jgi:hypothetical protein
MNLLRVLKVLEQHERQHWGSAQLARLYWNEIKRINDLLNHDAMIQHVRDLPRTPAIDVIPPVIYRTKPDESPPIIIRIEQVFIKKDVFKDRE